MTVTQWVAIGPTPVFNGQISGGGPVSGRITGIAADPTNADIVYIAAAGGGIWKSTNATAAGPTWTPLTGNGNGDGVLIDSSASGVSVQGNYIGTDVTGA